MVLIAVLAAAALFSSNQEARATATEMLDQQAFSFAERAGWLAVDGWICGGCDSLAVGGVITRSTYSEPPFESTVYTTRLDSALYLVVAEGRVVNRGSTRLKRRIAIAVGLSRDSAGIARAFPLPLLAWSAMHQM
jgi:hypothetical protein